VLALHVVQVAIYGAYKAPREVNCWLGLGLLGVTLGFSLTGYLFLGSKRVLGDARRDEHRGTVPVIGKATQQLLQGGPSTAA